MTDHDGGVWVRLPPPAGASPAQRRTFSERARELAGATDPKGYLHAVQSLPDTTDIVVRAAISILADFAAQGWRLRVERAVAFAAPSFAETDPIAEKDRVRQMESWKRDEQLRKPSVRRFVQSMERPRLHDGRFVSIFNLMRDGHELSCSLAAARDSGCVDDDALREVIDPYLQVVDPSSRCAYTGLRLLDVWRYFRHTWVTQYGSTPGRTMMLLVRDAAANHHPVIGIAALSSPIVQISERDVWIGWQPERFLTNLEAKPTAEAARWIVSQLDRSLSELHLDDLISDGLYWPALWANPDSEVIARLRKESGVRRRNHARFVRSSDLKRRISTDEGWVERAETDLFRSKRSARLADLLTARSALIPFLSERVSKVGLRAALKDRAARQAIGAIVRRAKGSSVGTEMADLSVCGAVQPYNAILGGKLVSMLSVSPSVVRAYRAKYGSAPSEIASAMAGRAIHRRSHLVYVGTTSLYGSGSSQYNRIRIPDHVLSGSTGSIVYERLGRSKSYGTAHISSRSMELLVSIAEQHGTGRRINSIFGEGSSPKFRKLRDGLDLLGWPSHALLRHGRSRLVYGVPLVRNLLPYLLGMRTKPQFLFAVSNLNDSEQISGYWLTRWLADRIGRPGILDQVARHTLARPVAHGARVALPGLTEGELLGAASLGMAAARVSRGK